MPTSIPPPPPGYGNAPLAQPAPAGYSALPLPRPVPTRRAWYALRPLLGVAALGVLLLCTLMSLSAAALALTYGAGVLPGVMVQGVALGGLSVEAATELIRAQSASITLAADGEVYFVSAASLGITLDAAQSAQAAYAIGRTQGNALAALVGQVTVAPVFSVDVAQARLGLQDLAAQVERAPLNAGVAYADGQVSATPPQAGRALDIEATLAAWQAGQAQATWPLVMVAVAPPVSDSSALVAQAQALLNNPLSIRVFDPVTDASTTWSADPAIWGTWLSVTSDPASPIGLSLSADPNLVADFLMRQAANTLDPSRSVDIEQGVSSIAAALAAGDPGAGYVRVVHQARQHAVRPGETITSIAWDYGIPYLYIVQANGGLEAVSVGQVISIPPADSFLLLPVVPHKRIVVSISQQRMWAYENGALVWDWVASTGIADSPTWPGVYQIISHEENAYAGNWDLYMPWFMGVYQPVPGAAFTNGFHGFPTRGGGQLLWERNLGQRVTYGCILVSSSNAKLLYDWAEQGVVVEIKA